MNPFQKAIKHVQCPKCGALPGVGCTLKSGKPAISCHNERLREMHLREMVGML